MTIPASEVWVVDVDQMHSNGVPLSGSSFAPDSFETMDAVEEFIQSNYDIGDYQILRIERTVTVEPEHEMFAEYTEADMEAIEGAKEIATQHDDVYSAVTVTDFQMHLRDILVNGMRISPTAYDVDLVVRAFLNDRDIDDVAADVAAGIDGLRLLGWRSENHYERRGARPEDAVEMLFVRDIEPLATLRESIDEFEWATGAWNNTEGILFIPLLKNRQPDADIIITTDVTVGESDGQIGFSGMENVDSVKKAFDAEVRDDFSALDDMSGYALSAIGATTSTESESGYVLALGVVEPDD